MRRVGWLIDGCHAGQRGSSLGIVDLEDVGLSRNVTNVTILFLSCSELRRGHDVSFLREIGSSVRLSMFIKSLQRLKDERVGKQIASSVDRFGQDCHMQAENPMNTLL